MPSPLVSIIIPTYNRLPIVCRAIDSVLSQSYKQIECIVVDDFSNDGTVDVLSKKYGSQITILQNEKNFDKSYSRNRGINNANGNFICFLDSDDELTPKSIESRLEVFLDTPSFKGVSFGMRMNENSSPETALKSIKLMARESLTLDDYLNNTLLLSTNSFLIPKKLMLEHGMYNEAINNKEDIELFLRLLTSLPFIFCGTVVTTVHQDAKNRTRNDEEKFLLQKNIFTETISTNTSLMEKLGPRFKDIQKEEHNEILRALYRTCKGKKYRRTYRDGWSNKLSSRNFKFLKRYLLSYFHSES